MPAGTGIAPPRCHPPPDGGTLRHVNNSLPGPLSEGSVHGNGSRQPENWLSTLAEPFVTVLAHGNGVSQLTAGRPVALTAPPDRAALNMKSNLAMVGFFLKDRNRRYTGKLLRIVESMDPQINTFELEKVQFIIPLLSVMTFLSFCSLYFATGVFGIF